MRTVLCISLVLYFPLCLAQEKKKASVLPAEVTIKGDLEDAQRIYAAIQHLKPTPKIRVEVQSQKTRKESFISDLTEQEKTELLKKQTDPFAELVKGGVKDSDLIVWAAQWDMGKENAKLFEEWRNAEGLASLQILAKFYGVKEDVPLSNILPAVGWKQLEKRGVTVVFPAAK